MILIEIAEFTQTNNQESNEIPEDQRQRRDQSQPRQQNSFQELGFGIFGESMVHVSLPIKILPLFPLLNQTQHLVITLQH